MQIKATVHCTHGRMAKIERLRNKTKKMRERHVGLSISEISVGVKW